jgi:hypothetical protein
MKTLNFLEALEANKTIEVRHSSPNSPSFKINELRTRTQRGEIDINAMQEKWFGEEKFVLECVWTDILDEHNNLRARPEVFHEQSDLLLELKNKKTRLTIELLD